MPKIKRHSYFDMIRRIPMLNCSMFRTCVSLRTELQETEPIDGVPTAGLRLAPTIAGQGICRNGSPPGLSKAGTCRIKLRRRVLGHGSAKIGHWASLC
jgi:hypothetical protein